MDYLEHEYLVPVIIGDTTASLTAAKTVYKTTEIKPHLFAERFTLRQRWHCLCHKVSPPRDFLMKESLISFAESLEEHFFPILIPCGVDAENFIDKYADELDCFYVVIPYSDISKKRGERSYDEDR